jgi:MFS family permease
LRQLFSGRLGRIAAGLLVAEFVAATQGLVIAAIMPRVVADLHGLAAYSLAFGSFFAAFLVVLPFAGPWSDRYGSRRTLAFALSVLALGLGLVAISPNMPFFVGARFVEGIGDGVDYAVSFAVIGKAFPDALRARMLSLTSAAWVVPAIVGPGLGAYVATAFGWRWAFAGFLPLVAIAAVLLLPAIDWRPAQQPADVLGALRLLFSRATLRANDGLHASFIAFALLHATFFGSDAYVALMLTAVRGLSLQLASACITLAAVGWSVVAVFAPALLARFGKARVVLFGAAACLLGGAGLLAVALGAAIPLAFVACTISGAGIGLTYPTLSAAAFGFAEPGDEGAVSSATLMAGIIGIIAGVLACGLSVALASRTGAPLATPLAYSFGIAVFFAATLAGLSSRLSRTASSPVRTSP